MEMDAREPLLLRRTDPWGIHMRFSEYLSRVPAMAWPLAGAIGMIIYLYIGSHTGQSAYEPKPTMAAVENCSPFNDIHDRRELSFDGEKHLVTEFMSNQESNKVGPSRDGVFAVDELTKSVTVRFGNEVAVYNLINIAKEDLCVLTSGDASSANLMTSWYGTISPPEDDDN